MVSIQSLKTVTLFSKLDEGELAALAERMVTHSYSAGRRVFSFGESGDSLYIISSGEVEISVKDSTGDKIVLTTLGTGEFFGELALFDPGTRTATALVLQDATIIELARDSLNRFLAEKPDASLDILAVMARRLREADHLLMGRVTRNLNAEFEHEQSFLQRVATWIAEFSGSMAFLCLNATAFFIWITINLGLIPGIPAFDPYPFGFLTMSVSLEAIFLSIFVLLAQNLQSAKERLRSDVEYQINLKAELGVTELHDRLLQLQSDIGRRLSHIERSLVKADPTPPSELLRQVSNTPEG